MTCVSEGIISQLLVLPWMILKGTHRSLSEGGAPHPVLSCLAVCSCPSFLSLSSSSSGNCPWVIPSCSDSWSHGRMELAMSRPDTCSESSGDSARQCAFSKAACAPAVGGGEGRTGAPERSQRTLAREISTQAGRP